MDQLFNVNGRFLPLDQAQKIMAEKRGESSKEEIKEEVPEKKEEAPVEAPVEEPAKEPVKEVITSSEFVCDVCQKVCKSKAGLAVHMLKHK